MLKENIINSAFFSVFKSINQNSSKDLNHTLGLTLSADSLVIPFYHLWLVMADARYQGWLHGPDLGHPRRNINSLFNSETFNCSRGPASRMGTHGPGIQNRNREMEHKQAHQIPLLNKTHAQCDIKIANII